MYAQPDSDSRRTSVYATLLEKLREAGFDLLDYKYVGFCELIVQAKKPHDAG